MKDRPLYLALSTAGMVAAGSGDDVRSVGPDEAAALAGPADAVTTDDTVAAPPGGVVSLQCPTALAVTADGVQAWSPLLGRRVPLSGQQVRALVGLGAGMTADSPDAQALLPLVSLGVLSVRPPGHAVVQGGYLKPRPAAVPRPVPPPRTDAVPVHLVCASHIAGVPLALGMLSASARAHDGGRLLERFDLRPVRAETATTVAEVEARPVPSVLLCSNYLWSVPENLELSRRVKELAPGSITVHGGPSTPKYPGDVEAFLADHPHVDVLVLGEGEVTIVELLDRLVDGLDVDRVAGIPGTVVRTSSGQVVRGPDRERMASLDDLPSPYLMGLFDHLDGGVLDLMPIETNRGCPYGCTFCDWGSATMSRIRTVPMERVQAELEWIAARGVGTLFIADANFGILPRDLEIAEHLVELRSRYGAPRTVLVSFAKNQTMRAAEIVRTWIEGGIVTEGSIALQSSDGATLEIIRRKNIRVERYDELTEAFRALRLPMAVDLMMGLPGSTVDSFRADLQRCIDGELTARIYPTMVLPNSPMNEPGYRAEQAIRTDAAGIVIGTASYDDDDYRAMLRIRRLYRAGDHFGVLRHVGRWAQYDHGLAVTDLLVAIDRRVTEDPGSWPSLVWVARHLARWTVPPPGWPPFLDEVRRLLVDELGLPDDAALGTALAVQQAHLPWPGRSFPDLVDLPHDYVGWYTALRRGAADHRPLSDWGPGRLVVTDPRGICGDRVGSHLRAHEHPDVDNVMLNEFWIADDWELESPLTRALPQVLADERSAA